MRNNNNKLYFLIKFSELTEPLKKLWYVSALMFVVNSAHGELEKPIILLDTPLMWVGVIDQINLIGDFSVPFKQSTNWAVTVREFEGNGDDIKNDLDVNAIHRVAPHAGEIAPNRPFPWFLFDVVPGGPVVGPGQTIPDPEFGGKLEIGNMNSRSHGMLNHIDKVTLRYDPITQGTSRLTIRLEHLPEPSTVVILLLGLTCLGFVRRK